MVKRTLEEGRRLDVGHAALPGKVLVAPEVVWGPAGAYPGNFSHPIAILPVNFADYVPTVDDVLNETATGGGWYLFPAEGGAITVARDELGVALGAAYDPCMAAWPSMVEIDA